MNIKGCVEKVIFRNEDNGYTVMLINSSGKEVTCVGILQYINVGEYLSMEGEMKIHPVYEEQFVISGYTIEAPEDTTAVLRYLSSGAVRGIGPKLADRIVSKFGDDTFRIIEEEPERLKEVRGISERMAMELAAGFEEKRDMRKAMMYLQKYGISSALSVKIYNRYGQGVFKIMETNPYRLADDIDGVGFKAADDIAKKAGIRPDSDFRIKSGILHVLSLGAAGGHACMPMDSVINHAQELLQIKMEDGEHYFQQMAMEKSIIIKERPASENMASKKPASLKPYSLTPIKYVYAANYYYTELAIARILTDLNIADDCDEKMAYARIANIEKAGEYELDFEQKNAIMSALKNGVSVITGGPGTGKTTTINAIIRYFEDDEYDIRLAASTGRAAKRMSEATGREACTIHRLLEINGNPDDNANAGGMFERNEDNPIDADLIIIDEMSMVDMFLMCSLLKAISVGTRLVLVGDSNQLPSVGPGNVLKDIVNSGTIATVTLKKIFRQAGQSDIIINAHKINAGEDVVIDNKGKDFLLVKRDEPNKVVGATVSLIRDKLPSYVNAKPFDIQVITPMRKGMLGVERLNRVLQHYLNPESPDKNQIVRSGDIVFREGDKVMQTKNNYQLEWEIRGRYGIATDKGTGVFNGDMGIISRINTYTELVEVEFDDGRMVVYRYDDLEELELAYAITIHKSQGSEYPAVIMPILTGPKMLMTRNLLYTGVTRAKKCVCIVGTQAAVTDMIHNETEQKRYSGLEHELRKMEGMQL